MNEAKPLPKSVGAALSASPALKTVLIGRRPAELPGLVAALSAARGLRLLSLPLLKTVDLPQAEASLLEAVRTALAAAHRQTSFFIFSSKNSVRRVSETLKGTAEELSAKKHLRCLAVGPATKQILLAAGFRVTAVAEPASQEGLLKALRVLGKSLSAPLLWPRAKRGRPFLEIALRREKIAYSIFPLYETRPLMPPLVRLKALQEEATAPHCLALTSSSMVEALAAAFKKRSLSPRLPHSVSIAMGPPTLNTFNASGLQGRVILARRADFAGMVETMLETVAGER